MLATQRSLTTAQLSRNTIAEVAESKAPLREATLESFRRRNAILDAIFYDVGKVTPNEAAATSPWLAREGSILIVPPTGMGELRLCLTIDDFAAAGGAEIRMLAVAGGGSSALGSAAFARNVADAFAQPVAAVVSGYGLADLVTEAAGGWFWFGALNRLRHQFEQLDDLARSPPPSAISDAAFDGSAGLGRLSLDTRTVCSLLSDGRFKFTLLTGHSKGNLVISEALYELEQGRYGPFILPQDAWIIKISAAIVMPKSFKNAINFMGGIDWFGAFNSRFDAHIDKRWPFSWHHTNTETPFHLPVTNVLTEFISERSMVV